MANFEQSPLFQSVEPLPKDAGISYPIKTAAYLIGGLIFLSVAIFGTAWYERELIGDVYNPLGEYPTQTVIDVNLNSVDVVAVKCNNSDQPVDVTGSLNWQRVDPVGFVFAAGTGVGVREPGCATLEFENTIPSEVKRANCTECVWIISGIDTPYKPDTGERGVPRIWQTEEFQLPSFNVGWSLYDNFNLAPKSSAETGNVIESVN